ncbi:MAG: type IV pilus modification PilV family protein [Desulfobulbus sp.]|jgi:hypothetical protein
MPICSPLRNRDGATLIEALIAMAILTIGILTVMVMQIQAISASSTALNRTEANTVAQTLLEIFKEVEFDNPILDATSITTADLEGLITPAAVEDLIKKDSKVHRYTAENRKKLPEALRPHEKWLKPGDETAGTVIDQAGIRYQVGWGVEDSSVSHAVGHNKVVAKTIWLFMTWHTPTGANRLTMATIKYRNINT